jgi:hypothetical protein
LDEEVSHAAGAERRDGIEHADEVGSGVGVGAVAGPVLQLEAACEFETFGLEFLAWMPGAVFEDGVDRFPGDISHGLAKSHHGAIRRLRRNAAEYQQVREAADRIGAAAEAEQEDPVAWLVSISEPLPSGATRAARPKRFYAKIALDPNRPTPQVSNIAQPILSELDRVRGTRMTLTLDIDAETADGFPEDVESVVRDNAASLRITDFGFEGE